MPGVLDKDQECENDKVLSLVELREKSSLSQQESAAPSFLEQSIEF